MKVITISNGIPTATTISTASPYSESIYYSSGLAADTEITLPNSGSFADSAAKDILVTVNDTVKEVTRDFTVVGAGPTYTKIKFGYDLPSKSVVCFRQGI